MSNHFIAVLAGLTAVVSVQAQPVPEAGYPINPVPFTSVKIEQNSFWGSV